jgi:hypothetical protein
MKKFLHTSLLDFKLPTKFAKFGKNWKSQQALRYDALALQSIDYPAPPADEAQRR